MPAIADVKSAAEIAAICIGGLWAYMAFVRKRINYPHVKVEHSIFVVQVSKHSVILNLQTQICNVGETLLRVTGFKMSARLVSPTVESPSEAIISNQRSVSPIGWRIVDFPIIATYEYPDAQLRINPGESHQECASFFVNCVPEVVLVSSYLDHPTSLRERVRQWLKVPNLGPGSNNWRAKAVKRLLPNHLGWPMTTIHKCQVHNGGTHDDAATTRGTEEVRDLVSWRGERESERLSG